MLSTGAFNALLKTLEEPPSYVMFILATTEPHKIPVTIHSRCQRYDFRRITVDTIAARLRELVDRENVQAEEKALRYIARAADGSMRDALSLLDQCIAFYLGQELTYERALEVLGAVDTAVYSKMFRHVVSGEVLGCVSLIDEMMLQGRDLSQFINEFIWYLRGLLLVDAAQRGSELLDVSEEQRKQMQEEAKLVSVDILIRYIRNLSELSSQIRYSDQKRVLIEVAFIKLCRTQMETDQDLSSLTERILALERQLENGVLPAKQPEQPVQEPPKETTVKPEILPKALPEDIEAVIRRWNEVVRACGQPGGNMLMQAKKVISDSGALLLQFTDRINEDYFNLNDGQELNSLKIVIQNLIGKEIAIETRTVDEKVDREYGDISKLIHFDDIEIQ